MIPADTGFVRSLSETPDDLELRRIFADWLQDQEDQALAARGELIRLQAELAAWVPERLRREELLHREQALLPEVRREWLAPWLAQGAEGTFVNGLPRVTLEARRFLTQPLAGQVADLMRAGWVEMVRLEGLRLMQTYRLATCPALGALAGLDLSWNNLADQHLRPLLGAELEGLRQLDLSGNQLTDESAQLLADSGLLERLVRLDLRHNRLSDAGVRTLLAAVGRQLRSLELYGNNLSREGLRRLRGWRDEPCRRVLRDGLPARLLNSVGMELVLVPAGEFLMGSPPTEPERDPTEGPQHEVVLTRPFYLGACQVSQGQYAQVMGANPSHFRPGGSGEAEVGGQETRWLPVEMVSLQQARDFCQRLAETHEEECCRPQSFLPADRRQRRRYRLPTEAEWEHACRAGVLPNWPFSFGTALGMHQANCNGEYPSGASGSAPGGAHRSQPTPGGSFPANPFGLFDMHGNCWDWCGDRYSADYYLHSPREDPTGPTEGASYVIRGGSWFNPARYCRAAERYGTSTSGSFCISFRVVLETDQV